MSGTDSPVLTPSDAGSARSRHLPTRPLADRRSATPPQLRSLRSAPVTPRCAPRSPGRPARSPPSRLSPASPRRRGGQHVRRPLHSAAHRCTLPHPFPARCIAGTLRPALASRPASEERGDAPQGDSGLRAPSPALPRSGLRCAWPASNPHHRRATSRAGPTGRARLSPRLIMSAPPAGPESCDCRLIRSFARDKRQATRRSRFPGSAGSGRRTNPAR
jgi:hypothetical protein